MYCSLKIFDWGRKLIDMGRLLMKKVGFWWLELMIAISYGHRHTTLLMSTENVLITWVWWSSVISITVIISVGISWTSITARRVISLSVVSVTVSVVISIMVTIARFSTVTSASITSRRRISSMSPIRTESPLGSRTAVSVTPMLVLRWWRRSPVGAGRRRNLSERSGPHAHHPR